MCELYHHHHQPSTSEYIYMGKLVFFCTSATSPVRPMKKLYAREDAGNFTTMLLNPAIQKYRCLKHLCYSCHGSTTGIPLLRWKQYP